jgi:hypothetical protein
MERSWGQVVWTALAGLEARLTAVLPGIIAMVVLVVLGIVLGVVVRAAITRGGRAVGFDRAAERWGLAASMRRAGIVRRPTDALGAFCFWVIFVLFAGLGIDALGVSGGAGATAFLLAFLPPLFAAVLIIIVGWLVANFLSQGLLIAAVNAGLPEARLLARAVHWGVLLFTAAMALTHLGIGKEMVLVAFGISFGGLVFALALAFGLGGRGIARDLLLRRLRRESPPPQERLTHL